MSPAPSPTQDRYQSAISSYRAFVAITHLLARLLGAEAA
jgi:hypothetical protein